MGIDRILMRLPFIELFFYFSSTNGGGKLRILPTSSEKIAWGLILLDSTDIVVLVHQISYFEQLNDISVLTTA